MVTNYLLPGRIRSYSYHTPGFSIVASYLFSCIMCSFEVALTGQCVPLLSDGIWTPKLSGRPFQHHNVQFYCISNLFTMILTPPPPQKKKTHKKKKSRAKRLSPSHLEEHNCLSFIQLHKDKKKKLSGFKMERRGKVHSSHDHGLVL